MDLPSDYCLQELFSPDPEIKWIKTICEKPEPKGYALLQPNSCYQHKYNHQPQRIHIPKLKMTINQPSEQHLWLHQIDESTKIINGWNDKYGKEH